MESNHIASLRQLPFPLVKLIEPGIGFRIGDETREFSLAGTAGETWTFTDATTGLQVALSLQVVDQAVVVSGVLQNSGSAPASGIRKLDLRWSRWDYNIEPMPFWKELDPTLKIQFEYFAGLYRVLDTLMEEHPNWMVEGCASGGRRIDIGTMKRAHTYWFSDQTEIAAVCRYMQARANRFLPGHLLNSSVAVAVGAGDEGFSDTSVLSRMLGKLAFDGDIGGWSPAFTVRMGSWVAVFKAIRHLLVQDFYQLLPQPQTAEDWDAVQFVSYSGEEAITFAFSGCQGGDKVLKLRGLRRERTYVVTRMPDGAGAILSGASLMDGGLPVSLQQDQGVLWRLRAENRTSRTQATADRRA